MISLTIAAALAVLPPQFLPKPCADPLVAKVATCGTVAVPENRDKPEGRQVGLNVVLFRATLPAPHLPPLFEIDGGPGLAVTRKADFYVTDGAPYRQRRDVVMIDQRGTGGSNPLSCPELGGPEGALKPMLPADAVARCRASLEGKADLDHYLTQDAVADIDAVRAVLGYERIDIFGLSYGTTVALRYLATHPGRVRAAFLMSVAPPTAMPPANHATAGERAFRLLAAECAADKGCSSTYDLDKDYERAIAILPTLDNAPAAEVFTEKLRSLMYQPSTARRIPWIVHAASEGNLTPFLEATRQRGPGAYFDGMFLAVTCAEGFGLMNFEAASAAARATRFGDYRLRRQRAACDAWGKTGSVPKDFLAPVTSRAAVLMISGGLDPVTPPEWAETLVKSLPNARQVVIPASGHIFDGLSRIDTCLDPMILRFLDSGDLKAVDAGCLAKMQPPPFATGAKPKP